VFEFHAPKIVLTSLDLNFPLKARIKENWIKRLFLERL